MTWAAIAILAFVTLQRLVELRLANRNTRRLLAEGAVEHSPGHYPFIVGQHIMWLAALWWWAPGRDINLILLALFALLQLGRVWVIATLGSRWTTRIIVQPGAPRLRSGLYRYLDHPNYAIVTAEIAVLPLVFGLVEIAVAFSLLNAIILWVRIRAENKALESLRQ
ncbi:MAG TPA: isoprenylcysteine carboxylmethyltransferase family protein [Sphingomicrobium sp.]|nr:isoprenylcysteine carboxylmethyltransferase family protein [Sphingomicrobium sp.]